MHKDFYKTIVKVLVKNAANEVSRRSPLGRLGWAGVLGGGAGYGASKAMGHVANLVESNTLPFENWLPYNPKTTSAAGAAIRDAKIFNFLRGAGPKIGKYSKYVAGTGAAALGLKYLIDEHIKHSK